VFYLPYFHKGGVTMRVKQFDGVSIDEKSIIGGLQNGLL